MSDFIAQVTDPDGNISPKALASQFHITIKELALMSGLSVDSLIKRQRALSRPSQARLQEVSLIINRVVPWCSSPFQAYAWYRSEGIPGFGGLTAEQLVKRGKANQVKGYLERINEGGYV